jgi:hypothetical protein
VSSINQVVVFNLVFSIDKRNIYGSIIVYGTSVVGKRGRRGIERMNETRPKTKIRINQIKSNQIKRERNDEQNERKKTNRIESRVK